MYNNIGLTTVRGTATSGHVQSNSAYVRPSSTRYRLSRNLTTDSSRSNNGASNAHQPPESWTSNTIQQRQRDRRLENKDLGNGGGNSSIQTHERKRRLENRLLELRERLEEDQTRDGGEMSDALLHGEIEQRIEKEREWQVGKWKEEEREEERIRTQRQQRLTDGGNSNGGDATVLLIHCTSSIIFHISRIHYHPTSPPFYTTKHTHHHQARHSTKNSKKTQTRTPRKTRHRNTHCPKSQGQTSQRSH